MNGKHRINTVLNHHEADTIACDFGATTVTGIHCLVVEGLREYYGLEKRPVRISEPYQMLGAIDEDLALALGIDCIGVSGPYDMFGIKQENWSEVLMPWGQTVLLPKQFKIRRQGENYYTFPEGDDTLPPSGIMPESGFFFNGIERQDSEIDDDRLDINDNLEEFTTISEASLDYWENAISEANKTGRAVVASFGGMGLGDVAMVPAMNLKHPKGIRNITEWYMSIVMRQDYIHQIFDKQTDIAIGNLEKLNARVGGKVDVAYICGTDFGTQDSQFCSSQTFDELYLPYYKKMNDWIHKNTSWKTFKHSCGAIAPLIENLLDAGFDILNPVQINAKDMNPYVLKEKFGSRVTFWGGGIDTQRVLPYGTKEEIRSQVYELCEIFGKDGGFVFSSVHNIQANVPIENVVTLMETIKEIKK